MAQSTALQKDTFLRDAKAFSGFSVKDLKSAETFYSDTLGLDVSKETEGLVLNLNGAGKVFIYPKPDHQPATFTILNFPVTDIDAAADKLRSRGIKFESYEGEMKTDDKGVFRGADSGKGPNIAWFKDPAGNFLSIIEE